MTYFWKLQKKAYLLCGEGGYLDSLKLSSGSVSTNISKEVDVLPSSSFSYSMEKEFFEILLTKEEEIILIKDDPMLLEANIQEEDSIIVSAQMSSNHKLYKGFPI